MTDLKLCPVCGHSIDSHDECITFNDCCTCALCKETAQFMFERDALQAKLDIAVDAIREAHHIGLKKIYDYQGAFDDIYQIIDEADEALKRLEENNVQR